MSIDANHPRGRQVEACMPCDRFIMYISTRVFSSAIIVAEFLNKKWHSRIQLCGVPPTPFPVTLFFFGCTRTRSVEGWIRLNCATYASHAPNSNKLPTESDIPHDYIMSLAF